MMTVPFQRFISLLVLCAYAGSLAPLSPLLAQDVATATVRLPAPVKTKPQVTVNRTAPPSVLPPTAPRFSASPTPSEIFAARVLREPFVPVSPPAAQETAALARAISDYIGAGSTDPKPFEDFLAAHPQSAWAPSVRLNLGLHAFAAAKFTQAIAAYESAWNQAKTTTDPRGKLVADRAVAELLQMYARLGRRAELEALFVELGNRSFTGMATELVEGARQGLAIMTERPDAAFRCGPAALDRILAQHRGTAGFSDILLESVSTERGMDLASVAQLAAKVGLDYQAARRSPGAAIITPAVIHWKLGHYAALFPADGAYRVEDPTFGSNLYASAATIDTEGSGYFLVPKGPLPTGWTIVPEAEARTVWGKGNTTTNDSTRTTPTDKKAKPEGPCRGMAVANAHLMVVSLNLTDTPVGYAPPYGPEVFFTVTYNQREASQPSVPDFGHLGTKWIHNWHSFIDEARVATSGTYSFTPTVRLPSGGSDLFTAATGQGADFTGPYTFPAQRYSRSVLSKTSSTAYSLVLSDGSQYTFGRRTGAAGSYRYFLTAFADPTGQAVTLGYDGSNRLVTLTDALGQVTTLDYDLPADSLKITQVTDPFGREAHFGYDGSGRLVSITDVIGLESEFTYDGATDFVNTLTTPYGTSTFAFGVGAVSGRDRWLEITDPLGDKERVESRSDWPAAPGDGATPTGMGTTTGNSRYRNTLYWDRKAWRERPNDPAAARLTQWLHTTINETSTLPQGEKQPLETNRTWYNYEGQTGWAVEGTSGRPTKIGRVLDDGTTQLYTYEYNGVGRVTKVIDPIGRETRSIYAANGIDLEEVRQKTGAGANDYEILAKFTYNGAHQVLSATDAAGQVTTSTYNSAGQLSTVTNAKGEVTRFFYDPAGDPAGSRLGNGDRDPAAFGYLVALDGPLAGTGDETTFEYDGYGRVRIVTDTEGYAVTTDYDDLDRPTLVTYSDSTTRQIVYERLDVRHMKDRADRVTSLRHNALRQLVTSTDPLGRVTQFAWCKCGDLRLLIDPAGNQTSWTHDLQGRVVAKTYPDQTSVLYRYENTISRLKTVTDAKGQVASYQYFNDNRLKQVSYTGAVSTPTVAYTYDSLRPRVATMTDGVGTTTYAYHDIPDGPAATPDEGDGLLASVDGPWANDTLAYTYDELGRVVGRTINTTANELNLTYDALGRVDGVVNPLGTFAYTYVNATDRLASVTYPNSQVTNYDYWPNTAASAGNGDQRLKEIEHLTPGSANLSTFTYAYDVEGQITAWTRKYDGGSVLTSNFKYDAADQLTEASVPSVTSVVKEFVYRYDKAGNRTSEQIDAAVQAATVNRLNQITALSPNGPIRFEGALNEAGTVTINGLAADVAGDNSFKADVPLNAGSNTGTIVATDPASNATTESYSVPVDGGTSRTLTYDLNGNMLSNGAGQTYTWDSVDRMTKITYTGGATTEFTYDGLGRRVKIIEKNSGGTITSEKRFVWDGLAIAEERDGTNALTKRFYEQGVMVVTDEFYYTHDHLGSVRELTDDTGAVEARYDYDPYGRVTKLTGSGDADFRFTGHYFHATSGLHLAPYRSYDTDLGRWLSRDPIAEAGGMNLNGYVRNNPTNAIDPFGLRDVDVYVWEQQLRPGLATNRLAGHVMITEANSHKVLLSQFPHEAGGESKPSGPNTQLGYYDTHMAEKTEPSIVFRVTVPDDFAFDAAVKDHVGRAQWFLLPLNKNQTHCARSSYDALKAGGVSLPINRGQIMPGTLGDELRKLAKSNDSGVTIRSK